MPRYCQNISEICCRMPFRFDLLCLTCLYWGDPPLSKDVSRDASSPPPRSSSVSTPATEYSATFQCCRSWFLLFAFGSAQIPTPVDLPVWDISRWCTLTPWSPPNPAQCGPNINRRSAFCENSPLECSTRRVVAAEVRTKNL